MDLKKYPISIHFTDLKYTLKNICICLLCSTIISSFYLESLLNFLLHPIQSCLTSSHKIIILSPYEFFFIQAKILCASSLIISSPWIIFYSWSFIQPGIYHSEKKIIISLSALFLLCFIIGCLFAYFYVMPFSFSFLINSLPSYIEYHYSISSLISFSLNSLISFGLIFEIPILIFSITYFKIVEVNTLSKNRRYVIILSFIIAAIITPTSDPLIQTITAIPLIFFFEIGLLCSKICTSLTNAKRTKNLL
ncbi:MAG: twin-arginine translocase subunit TatC [Deltaproteobacteria bacterium]|nr:MAG: twin-arginine translocase subunit TatC [Deltaproteobacteria bacterium]